jgi:hypothetical protein
VQCSAGWYEGRRDSSSKWEEDLAFMKKCLELHYTT